MAPRRGGVLVGGEEHLGVRGARAGSGPACRQPRGRGHRRDLCAVCAPGAGDRRRHHGAAGVPCAFAAYLVERDGRWRRVGRGIPNGAIASARSRRPWFARPGRCSVVPAVRRRLPWIDKRFGEVPWSRRGRTFSMTPRRWSTTARPDVQDSRPLDAGYLAGLGVGQGGDCLELGSGNGSIVEWLCDAVGPSGSVTAADINTVLLELIPRRTSWCSGWTCAPASCQRTPTTW
jgi:hypothetical protein